MIKLPAMAYQSTSVPNRHATPPSTAVSARRRNKNMRVKSARAGRTVQMRPGDVSILKRQNELMSGRSE